MLSVRLLRCKESMQLTVSSSLAALWSSVKGMATSPRLSTARESPAPTNNSWRLHHTAHASVCIPLWWQAFDAISAQNRRSSADVRAAAAGCRMQYQDKPNTGHAAHIMVHGTRLVNEKVRPTTVGNIELSVADKCNYSCCAHKCCIVSFAKLLICLCESSCQG